MGSGVATLANKLANRLAFNSGIKQNLQLAEKLHKPAIRK